MNPHDILHEVYSVGATLELSDGRIMCPTVDRLPSDLRQKIGENKAALLALLREARIGQTDYGFVLPRRYVPPHSCPIGRTCARHGWCSEALNSNTCGER